MLVPTSNTSIFGTSFATVAPEVEPTHEISILDKFATVSRQQGRLLVLSAGQRL